MKIFHIYIMYTRFFLFFWEKMKNCLWKIWSVRPNVVTLHSQSGRNEGYCKKTIADGLGEGCWITWNNRLIFDLRKIDKCGNSSVGRAQPCQGWGREFESRFPLKIVNWCSRGGMVDALVSGASVERRASSILVVSTSILLWICGNSSVGRAQPCQGWGREFESRFPLKGNLK